MLMLNLKSMLIDYVVRVVLFVQHFSKIDGL